MNPDVTTAEQGRWRVPVVKRNQPAVPFHFGIVLASGLEPQQALQRSLTYTRLWKTEGGADASQTPAPPLPVM